jgi:hypothetical protein
MPPSFGSLSLGVHRLPAVVPYHRALLAVILEINSVPEFVVSSVTDCVECVKQKEHQRREGNCALPELFRIAQRSAVLVYFAAEARNHAKEHQASQCCGVLLCCPKRLFLFETLLIFKKKTLEFCILSLKFIQSSALPRNFFRGRGFNKFSWG